MGATQLSGRRRKRLVRRCPISGAARGQWAAGMIDTWSSHLTLNLWQFFYGSICPSHPGREHDTGRTQDTEGLIANNSHKANITNWSGESHTNFRCPSAYRSYVYAMYACTLACRVASVVSNSVRPHGQQPTRLLRPRDSLGKNTGVGCHCLLRAFIMFILYHNLNVQ